MANKTTRAINNEELEKIITTIRQGFIHPSGDRYKGNDRIACALLCEYYLGIRIGDVCRLRLSDIIMENGKWRLNIKEQKTEKVRNFMVPTEVYVFLQDYALRNNIKQTQRLFDITVRTVQNHLQKTCEYLGITGVGTHSFRKKFCQDIYSSKTVGNDILLIQTLLQHANLASTTRYLSVSSKKVEEALQNHAMLSI